MTKARCSRLPITCESGRQLFDLRLYCRPASAMLLCLAAILLLDVGMVAITALQAGVSRRKLSNGADNMYDLHDHRFMVVSGGCCPWLWTWAASQWQGHTIFAFCSLPVDVRFQWFGGATLSRGCHCGLCFARVDVVRLQLCCCLQTNANC